MAHGMIGTVGVVSDGRLRQGVRKESGLPPRDVSWVLVGFENGVVAAVDPEIKFEKLQTLQSALWR